MFTEPIKIVYSNLTVKIGQPRESKNFNLPVPPNLNLNVDIEDIMKNLEVDEHEIIYAQGGSIPLSKLYPMIKGNWRIKIRLTKKSDIRTWQNAKGEG